MDHLSAFCQSSGIVFQPEWSWVRCLAHVINLIVQDILSKFKPSKKLSDLSRELNDDESSILRETVGFPVCKLMLLVRKIRRSPQQIQKLKKIAQSKGLEGLMPILDVPTSWNSTFQMLQRCYQFRDVHGIHCFENKWNHLILNDSEWVQIHQLIKILQVFQEAINFTSSSTNITLNEYLQDSLKKNIAVFSGSDEIFDKRFEQRARQAH
eukprot:Pompholyxophrys_punicea_v1_NODE_899_length_1161_cov_6.495479.p1 type:complete len:210 gc:universal NODE_899_length_1161_cov_6.495479:432-1061(+)